MARAISFGRSGGFGRRGSLFRYGTGLRGVGTGETRRRCTMRARLRSILGTRLRSTRLPLLRFRQQRYDEAARSLPVVDRDR